MSGLFLLFGRNQAEKTLTYILLHSEKSQNDFFGKNKMQMEK
nr:MAG TPA: hypothetical protein [Caudoviricetes sp.]